MLFLSSSVSYCVVMFSFIKIDYVSQVSFWGGLQPRSERTTRSELGPYSKNAKENSPGRSPLRQGLMRSMRLAVAHV